MFSPSTLASCPSRSAHNCKPSCQRQSRSWSRRRQICQALPTARFIGWITTPRTMWAYRHISVTARLLSLLPIRQLGCMPICVSREMTSLDGSSRRALLGPTRRSSFQCLLTWFVRPTGPHRVETAPGVRPWTLRRHIPFRALPILDRERLIIIPISPIP